MNINPYLNFNGNCLEAFEYYAELMGADITFKQTFGESPMAKDTPPENHNNIMHATLAIGTHVIMGSDAPDNRYVKPQGIWVSLNMEDTARAEAIFTSLTKGGIVAMPFQATYFSKGFGMVTDRFNIPWMVHCG